MVILAFVIFYALSQDVTMKIMSSQQGSRAICILSATGTISNVTLRQSTSSGGTLTYEVSSILFIYIKKSRVRSFVSLSYWEVCTIKSFVYMQPCLSCIICIDVLILYISNINFKFPFSMASTH